MHFSTFAASLLLPFAVADVTVPVGGCALTTCYGQTCLGAAALYGAAGDDGAARCETMESWGCDCSGCECTDALDIETVDDVPDDYACSGDLNGYNCDEMAYLGYSCHYMETRRAQDCSGCLCEEAIHGYEKGDSSCPYTCMGSNCDTHTVDYNQHSCGNLETFDWVAGCDCSGCTTCDDVAAAYQAYNSMDCNGNGYWTVDMGNDTCDEDVNAFAFPMGNPDDGYEERSFFTCLNCPELECDMGDCGDSCERDGSTCALPLCELCADGDSVHTPTQFGRAQYCTEDSYTCAPSPAPTTAAPTVTATEATVAADEDGSFALTTTAVFAIALLLA